LSEPAASPKQTHTANQERNCQGIDIVMRRIASYAKENGHGNEIHKGNSKEHALGAASNGGVRLLGPPESPLLLNKGRCLRFVHDRDFFTDSQIKCLFRYVSKPFC
jgi:hypothetical protein